MNETAEKHWHCNGSLLDCWLVPSLICSVVVAAAADGGGGDGLFFNHASLWWVSYFYQISWIYDWWHRTRWHPCILSKLKFGWASLGFNPWLLLDTLNLTTLTAQPVCPQNPSVIYSASITTWLGMYVNHEFTIAVITVIFALCRDFRQLLWFCVTAVIIIKICTISTFKRSILGKYFVRISFLGAYSRMINPTSLLGVHRPVQKDGLMQCTAAQLFLRSDRLRYGACDHKHAAIASHIRSRGKKRPQLSASTNSLVWVGHVNKIVMYKLQSTVHAWVGYGSKRQTRWHGKRCGSIAPSVSAAYIGWIECRLAGGWMNCCEKMSHMTVKHATTYYAIKSCITLIVSGTASTHCPLAKD